MSPSHDFPDQRHSRYLRRMLPAATMVALAGALLATDADAISRYTSTSMTCPSIKETIRIKKAVILAWTSPRTGNPRYGRYVLNDNYCPPNQVVKLTSVPASNTSNCSVYHCVFRRVLEPFFDW